MPFSFLKNLSLKFWQRRESVVLALYLWRWLLISALVGAIGGSASALFLVLLDAVTEYREADPWIIWFLPAGGFLVGWLYHTWGTTSAAGNNLLIQEIQKPTRHLLPWVMAPLVLGCTLITHLVGGSAGREGTAAQMGGALADQLTKLLRLRPRDRRTLLICGVSAGFASVFGTPLAGTVFALEFSTIGKIRYQALVPALLAAIIADGVATAWGVEHTLYPTIEVPALTVWKFGATLLAGICFALAARIFSWASHNMAAFFQKQVLYAPLRPALGGGLLLVCILLLGTTKYIGLGIPTIVAAFETPLPPYDFLIKIALTALTLGCCFKGGEVTPLFFIGATLGNALSPWLPLPMELLVGMGFVAVFAGAANTPLACTLMAIELFGAPSGVYAALACVVAYLFSGHTGIYGSQIIGNSKNPFSMRETGQRLSERK
ncbi:chloride channel protein [Rufibacter immobilis]|uniref:chloride channel protein n=1 Tax=Rufibacter immobilis TaxID=1348778 RepID=UPI0035E8B719